MEPFIGSTYDRTYGHPYFDSRARYGRPADTIVFWYATTPTGRISKYWATLRINAEHNVSSTGKQNFIDTYRFPKMPKGYAWSAPLLYSGQV